MSRLNYFQTYSQPENHATNNTLLLLRHLYRLGPQRLGRVLSSLTDGALGVVGPIFTQQDRTTASVPDGAIRQEAFQVWVEAKRGGDLDRAQIKAHVDHAGKAPGSLTSRIVIGLTARPISSAVNAELTDYARSRSVSFVTCTFQDIVAGVRSELRDHEAEHVEILDDYEAFLESEGLLAVDHGRLAVLPCRVSIGDNVAFGFYSEPPARARKRTSLIGLYSDKAVRFLGRVGAIVTCDWRGGQPDFHFEAGEDTAKVRDRIRVIVESATVYDFKSDAVRYYLFDEIAETFVPKTSSGGIMGLRYLDLGGIGSSQALAARSVADVAKDLRSVTFE